MSFSFLRLDKRSQKSESSVNKRWKRTNARQGETSEKEPPISTPKWAISDEWKALLEQREEVEAERYVNCFMDLTTRKKNRPEHSFSVQRSSKTRNGTIYLSIMTFIRNKLKKKCTKQKRNISRIKFAL